MEYIVRIKCVSECIGIRRSSLIYLKAKDTALDLSTLSHPISKFKALSLNGNTLTVDGRSEELRQGEEIYFYKSNQVKSLDTTVEERLTLGAILMPLHPVMLKMYEKNISEGITFDQWSGEFEFLMGAVHELCNHDPDEANFYYDKAEAKGFSFGFKN